MLNLIMNESDHEKWKKIDLERSSNFIRRKNPINIENTKKIISARLKQIIQKLDISAKILIINCTWYDNLISEEILNEVDCFIKVIKKSNLEEFLNDIDNSIIKKKYDIILFQLPLGVKIHDVVAKSLSFKVKDTDDVIHEIIRRHLNDLGVALNISTLASFGNKVKKFIDSARVRQNILGPVFLPETNIDISLYEFIRQTNKIMDHPVYSYPKIECIDLTETILGKKNFKDAKVFTTLPKDFFDAKNTISQRLLREKHKGKEFKQLHSLTISNYRCDLTKSNSKKDKIIKELNKIENGIFIPTIPSKTNKVEINVKKLKPWVYWLVILDPTKINNEYAMNYLNSNLGKEQLLSHAIGSTIKHINAHSLSNIGIVFKTLSAQKKISETRKKIKDFLNASEDLISDLEEKGEDYEFDPENILKKMPNYEVDKLINLDESEFLERKQTLRKDTKKKEFQSYITDSCLKTIVAFLNSKGGKLIIGQKDNKEISGIEEDNFKTRDDWSKFFKDKVKTHIGLPFLQNNINFKFYEVKEKTIVIVDCKKLEKDKQAYLHDQDIYIRVGPSSERLSAKEALELFNKKK